MLPVFLVALARKLGSQKLNRCHGGYQCVDMMLREISTAPKVSIQNSIVCNDALHAQPSVPVQVTSLWAQLSSENFNSVMHINI